MSRVIISAAKSRAASAVSRVTQSDLYDYASEGQNVERVEFYGRGQGQDQWQRTRFYRAARSKSMFCIVREFWRTVRGEASRKCKRRSRTARTVLYSSTGRTVRAGRRTLLEAESIMWKRTLRGSKNRDQR